MSRRRTCRSRVRDEETASLIEEEVPDDVLLEKLRSNLRQHSDVEKDFTNVLNNLEERYSSNWNSSDDSIATVYKLNTEKKKKSKTKKTSGKTQETDVGESSDQTKKKAPKPGAKSKPVIETPQSPSKKTAKPASGNSGLQKRFDEITIVEDDVDFLGISLSDGDWVCDRSSADVKPNEGLLKETVASRSRCDSESDKYDAEVNETGRPKDTIAETAPEQVFKTPYAKDAQTSRGYSSLQPERALESETNASTTDVPLDSDSTMGQLDSFQTRTSMVDEQFASTPIPRINGDVKLLRKAEAKLSRRRVNPVYLSPILQLKQTRLSTDMTRTDSNNKSDIESQLNEKNVKVDLAKTADRNFAQQKSDTATNVHNGNPEEPVLISLDDNTGLEERTKDTDENENVKEDISEDGEKEKRESEDENLLIGGLNLTGFDVSIMASLLSPQETGYNSDSTRIPRRLDSVDSQTPNATQEEGMAEQEFFGNFKRLFSTMTKLRNDSVKMKTKLQNAKTESQRLVESTNQKLNETKDDCEERILKEKERIKILEGKLERGKQEKEAVESSLAEKERENISLKDQLEIKENEFKNQLEVQENEFQNQLEVKENELESIKKQKERSESILVKQKRKIEELEKSNSDTKEKFRKVLANAKGKAERDLLAYDNWLGKSLIKD